jgi:hypothetical protein
MLGPFRNIKAAFLYTAAGSASERGEYDVAFRKIERARNLLGDKIFKSNLFQFDLREANILRKLGKSEKAIERINEAKRKISDIHNLSELDRQYLLQYCEVIEKNVDNSGSYIDAKFPEEHLPGVSVRYRQEYPLTYGNSGGMA